MKINENLTITMTKANGNITIICSDGTDRKTAVYTTNNIDYDNVKIAYDKLRFMNEDDRDITVANDENFSSFKKIINSIAYDDDIPMEEKGIDYVEKSINKMMNFFTEFNFSPNYRFINTLSNTENDKQIDYINNYFNLTDNVDKEEIREKLKSEEFRRILSDFNAVKANKTINHRIKIYYGSQGTGKTTKAQEEANKRCVICNSSMLPSDLMEDFVFIDGKATFKPSLLWRCMEEGVPIVLDELNLLPYDSLRFLQGITDGKSSFEYKGNTVNVKDGFYIIGTMNLVVNGNTYGLPEPLIDRCFDLEEFKLTAKQLLNAITD